jgi:ABC-type lipopolysaccharide export system ATPase subunit
MDSLEFKVLMVCKGLVVSVVGLVMLDKLDQLAVQARLESLELQVSEVNQDASVFRELLVFKE